jgi:hypothetical protein
MTANVPSPFVTLQLIANASRQPEVSPTVPALSGRTWRERLLLLSVASPVEVEAGGMSSRWAILPSERPRTG